MKLTGDQLPVSSTGEMGALSGLRVVDFSHYLAGPLTAMVLGDLGADVVRVDPPGGPRWDHPANAILQRGKRSIVLDLRDEEERRAAQRLVERADIVIESFRPGSAERLGLGAEPSLRANPRLIYCSMPGFAADDARAGWPAWEGVIDAAVGFYLYPGCTPMNYVGDRSGEPIYSAIPQASSYGAFVALHSVMAALVARERCGRGQHVDVPLHDAAHELVAANVQQTPVAGGGGFPGSPPPQLGRYQCADGKWLELCLFQDRHLEWFAQAFMPQEWIDEGMGDAQVLLFDEELKKRAAMRFAELLATRPALEWEIAINEQSGASAALCSTAEYWLREDSHARDNEQVIELDDPQLGPTSQAGYPVRMSRTPPHARGPRRMLDADRQEILRELEEPLLPRDPAASAAEDLSAALEGIRVLDVSQVLAGPTVGRILAEYGAEVVKIHSFEDRQLGMHLYTNSGKRSIMVNLKTPEGLRIFWQLAEGLDVFVENFTRGVCDRMGIGETALRDRNPGIVYAAISAFGRDGYRGGWRGREQLGQGVTGMQARLGGYGETPLMAPMAYCDYGSGNLTAFAVLVALYHRLRTGEGQNVQSSLAHAGTFLQIPYMVAYDGATWDEPNGQHAKGWGPLDRLYRCADRWLYLAAPHPDDAARLADVEGLSGIAALQGDDLERMLVQRLAGDTAQTWQERLTAAGIGAHVLMDFTEVMDDERARAIGLSLSREHPGVGIVSRVAGPSPRLSLTPPRPTRPAGPPGADTRPVLESLGYNGEVDGLVERGVVRDGLPQGTTFIGMFR